MFLIFHNLGQNIAHKFSKSNKIVFFYVKCSKIHPLQFSTILFGIYNFRVTKQGYKTELHIMTSQTELLTLKFFELITRCEKNFNIILELVTRAF